MQNIQIKDNELETGEPYRDENEEEVLADQYLLFTLKETVYGIDIAGVTEIIEMQKVTGVPDMPHFIKGVINLRGRVTPLMSLRLRFGMEEKEYDNRTCIIVVNEGASPAGFIVDTVAEVYNIPDEQIEGLTDFRGAGEKNHYIAGIGKIGEKIAVIIDGRKIVHDMNKAVEEYKNEK